MLYKYNNNIIIKNINYWHNEIPELSGHNRKKLKVLDCPFICDMNNGKQYLMGFMMRVKPDKIRFSHLEKDYWVLDGTKDQMRPYRIMIKDKNSTFL